jgi:hypothetical protein
VSTRRPAAGAGARAVPDRGGLVPLPVVRGTTALIAVLLGTLVWNGSVWVVLPVVVAAGAAFIASIGMVAVSLLLLVVAYAVNMPPGSPWLPVFVAGLHAVFLLYLLLLPLPLRGWISGAALRAIAWSFLRLQAVAQPVALLALLVDDAGSSVVAVLAGVGALVAWVLWLVGRPVRETPDRG